MTFVGQIKQRLWVKLRINPQIFDLFKVSKITANFFYLPKVMTTKFLTWQNDY